MRLRLVLCGIVLAALVAPVSPAQAAAGTWTEQPVGFAAGTTGGAQGEVVRATDLTQLRAYAAATEPLVVLVVGSITVAPFGDMVRVASDKTVIGAGPGAELVGGGLFLNGTHNVIIRNLTIRDSYVAGDWDGKTADNDGIRLDTAHHVWIDHVKIQRVGDGGIDIRKDSDNITLSWNVISDINKALGVGWTSNVITKLTAHHNWIRNTVQRNWSLDNTAAAHLYDNYLSDVADYGTMARNNGRVVVEDSVFERVNDPLVTLGGTSQIVQRRNIFTATSGRIDTAGEAFDPSAYYAYTSDPAAEAAALVKRFAGPQPVRRPPRTPRTITVALDGSGTYGSLLAALGATRDADGPVTIMVQPGTYRELVRVWPDQSNVTIVGAEGAEIQYDLPADGQKFYGGPYGVDGSATLAAVGNGTTFRGLTIANTYASGPAPAVRAVGDRLVFDGTRMLGHGGTYQADTPGPSTIRRSYLHDCYLEGDADFIAGPGTAVFDHCTIQSTGAGAVTAASTDAHNPYGFLFSHCVFGGDAAAGTVLLGRPAGPAAQVVVRQSWLGSHIAGVAWADGDGPGRFFEYANAGPGAVLNDDRPQLTRAQAAAFTTDTYLRHWRPRH